jgi:hypothetical protein
VGRFKGAYVLGVARPVPWIGNPPEGDGGPFTIVGSLATASHSPVPPQWSGRGIGSTNHSAQCGCSARYTRFSAGYRAG